MDGLWKAAATALTVAVLMGLARGAGHRVAGLLAALPTTTAPALVWPRSQRSGCIPAEPYPLLRPAPA